MFRWSLILLLAVYVAFGTLAVPVTASSLLSHHGPEHSDSDGATDAGFENAPVASVTPSKVLLLPGLIAASRHSVDLASASDILPLQDSQTANSPSLKKLGILRI